MLDTFKREKNIKERKRLHCVNCKRITIHKLEARCMGSWSDDRALVNGGRSHSIFRCGACDTVCYETSSWNSEDIEYDEDGEARAIEYTTQYPAPVSAHFNFNTESTPTKLNRILDELLYALAGSKMLTATIGLRLAIEYIVNDKECLGSSLSAKINDLRSKELIDEDQKDLLHRIRRRGNAGAHEAIGMNSKELIAGMSIVEGLLEKLYNGPARHNETIKRAKLLIKDN
ncbi:hypothetical protein DDF62_12530 [Caulobacter radicis]|uniref:DUF4145 domain-containing protein n=1 Tax=Caulobacter radicis TaxID=2172650 RepID=UPI000D575817|nr:DUF4145 domain-containing protein [Caulobacter radicis]PVM89326.1 hypothetical protein DDF62_12530 [Caulobacter radicis]